jgi:hypothetical protein
VVVIGNWVRRDVSGAKWHKVESVVAGAAITACGRRLEQNKAKGPKGALEVSEVEVLTRMIGQPQNCKRCST